jgi:hypothetical protein
MSTSSFTRPIVISDPAAVKKLKDIVYGEEEEEEMTIGEAWDKKKTEAMMTEKDFIEITPEKLSKMDRRVLRLMAIKIETAEKLIRYRDYQESTERRFVEKNKEKQMTGKEEEEEMNGIKEYVQKKFEEKFSYRYDMHKEAKTGAYTYKDTANLWRGYEAAYYDLAEELRKASVTGEELLDANRYLIIRHDELKEKLKKKEYEIAQEKTHKTLDKS